MTGLFELDRRSLIQRILVLAGATVIPAGCSDLSGGPGSDFEFEPKQFELLTALADTIIPQGDSVGALDAKVPAQFEGLMRNWASADRRTEILAGLDRVDAAANKAKGKDFAKLDPAARLEVLKTHETVAMKPAPEKAEGRGGLAVMMGPPVADEGYAKMRELIVKLFYMSEPALTGELPYEHDPNGYRPSVPITPDTRPSGGLSPF